MYKVLVVDDEPFIRVSLATMRTWRDDGFDFCYEASNGQQAFDIMEKTKDVDVVLLDLAMPVMDGLGFLEKMRLRESGTNPPVIVLSAHDEFQRVRKAFNLGILDYLIKVEIDENNLLEHLKRAVEKAPPRDLEPELDDIELDLLKVQILKNLLASAHVQDLGPLLPKLKFKIKAPFLLLSLWVHDYEKVLLRYPGPELERFQELFFRTAKMAFETHWNGELLSPQTGQLVFFANLEGQGDLETEAGLLSEQLTSALDEAFQRYLNIRVDPAWGPVCRSFAEVHGAYEALKRSRAGLSKQVLQARKFMLEHYADPDLTLAQIAETTGFSKNYLSWEFKRETEETVTEYLTKLRIEKACELISATSLKIYEVSESVGFANVEHFCRVFKRYIGVSPNHYLKNRIPEKNQ